MFEINSADQQNEITVKFTSNKFPINAEATYRGKDANFNKYLFVIVALLVGAAFISSSKHSEVTKGISSSGTSPVDDEIETRKRERARRDARRREDLEDARFNLELRERERARQAAIAREDLLNLRSRLEQRDRERNALQSTLIRESLANSRFNLELREREQARQAAIAREDLLNLRSRLEQRDRERNRNSRLLHLLPYYQRR